MLFSVVNGRYYYDSNTFLPSAANNDYILEEYPSQIRAVPQYDSSYNAFRPITPPYYQPAVATIRPGSYDKPATSYFDTEQIQMNLYPEYAQQPYYGGVHGQCDSRIYLSRCALIRQVRRARSFYSVFQRQSRMNLLYRICRCCRPRRSYTLRSTRMYPHY